MDRRAFTLLEMVLVLAITVILLSLAYPSFTSMQRSYRLEGAADAAKGGMASARAQAIEEGRPYRFAIVPGKGNFRVAPDSPAYWSGGQPPPPPDGTAPPLILEGHLEGAWFGEAGQVEEGAATALEKDEVGPDQWKAVAVFLPDGTARAPDATDDSLPEVVIPVATEGTRPLVVVLRLLTGTVTSRRAE
jgi:prepilin-type N-terminal cleavage/methylation domain-containing protein